jgi:hypothetical protein
MDDDDTNNRDRKPRGPLSVLPDSRIPPRHIHSFVTMRMPPSRRRFLDWGEFLRVLEVIELTTEWGEWFRESSGPAGRKLLHAAGLLWDPDPGTGLASVLPLTRCSSATACGTLRP